MGGWGGARAPPWRGLRPAARGSPPGGTVAAAASPRRDAPVGGGVPVALAGAFADPSGTAIPAAVGAGSGQVRARNRSWQSRRGAKPSIMPALAHRSAQRARAVGEITQPGRRPAPAQWRTGVPVPLLQVGDAADVGRGDDDRLQRRQVADLAFEQLVRKRSLQHRNRCRPSRSTGAIRSGSGASKPSVRGCCSPAAQLLADAAACRGGGSHHALGRLRRRPLQGWGQCRAAVRRGRA